MGIQDANMVKTIVFISTISVTNASWNELVAQVNAANTTWVASVPSRFDTEEDAQMLCGTVLSTDEHFKMPEDFDFIDHGEVNLEVPDNFDVRTQWPNCASVSGHIRDQSSCGSCWAHGTTEALNDRTCIASQGRFQTLLSVEDTTANCNLLNCFSMGCGGGQPAFVWQWFKRAGVVTGGDYTDKGKGDTCAPYSMPSCAHHVDPTPEHPKCPSKEYPTPSPFSRCKEAGYKTSYGSDKTKAASAYGVRGVANIQKDIMQFGSVTAAFTVYNDFVTYKSGVYQHHTGRQLGGHAVKMIGWGVENGTPYWLIVNSWNEAWGDSGTFKILRGSNHCGIEGQITAGHATVSEFEV